MPISTNLSKTPFPTVLVILDGFGISKNSKYNAIFHANTPTLDHLQKQFPYTLLQAAEEAVGLPKTYMGNSEVGHVTIGTGRIVLQSLSALNHITHPHNLIKNKQFIHLLDSLNKKAAYILLE